MFSAPDSKDSITHFESCITSSICRHVSWIPCAPPSPPDDLGRVAHKRIIVQGGLDTDIQENTLYINTCTTSEHGDRVLHCSFDGLTVFGHEGSMTSLKVSELTPGVVAILFGNSLGSLFCKRIQVPCSPGWDSSDLLDLDETDEMMRPKSHPFTAAVASVDVQSDTKRVLATSCAGGVVTSSVEELGTPSVFRGESAFGSVVAARWIDQNQFVASTLLGGLEIWDLRQSPYPSLRSPASFGSTGAPGSRGPSVVRCLEPHPVRPDVCATGGDDGCVAIWDLRFASRPACSSTSSSSAADAHTTHTTAAAAAFGSAADAAAAFEGPVWKLAFDTIERSSLGPADAWNTSALGVLFCTEGGAMGLATPTYAASPAVLFGNNNSSFNSNNNNISNNSNAATTAATAAGGEGGASGSLSRSLLFNDASSINAFDVYERSCGRELLAVTDRQTLVYARRA